MCLDFNIYNLLTLHTHLNKIIPGQKKCYFHIMYVLFYNCQAQLKHASNVYMTI